MSRNFGPRPLMVLEAWEKTAESLLVPLDLWTTLVSFLIIPFLSEVMLATLGTSALSILLTRSSTVGCVPLQNVLLTVLLKLVSPADVTLTRLSNAVFPLFYVRPSMMNVVFKLATVVGVVNVVPSTVLRSVVMLRMSEERPIVLVDNLLTMAFIVFSTGIPALNALNRPINCRNRPPMLCRLAVLQATLLTSPFTLAVRNCVQTLMSCGWARHTRRVEVVVDPRLRLTLSPLRLPRKLWVPWWVPSILRLRLVMHPKLPLCLVRRLVAPTWLTVRPQEALTLPGRPMQRW